MIRVSSDRFIRDYVDENAEAISEPIVVRHRGRDTFVVLNASDYFELLNIGKAAKGDAREPSYRMKPDRAG